ncbi:MAG: hypothetical protein IT274_08720 [Chitinophagales bacterium]|nr:hypothetical protein [Chitinophagales bacterium]
MKNRTISALFLLIAFSDYGKACSWHSEDEAFYNLFNQELISDQKLEPFLLTYDNIYYNGDFWNPAERSHQQTDANLEEWNKYFNQKIPVKDLQYLVYTSTVTELQAFLTNNLAQTPNSGLTYHAALFSEKGLEALQYLIFAKQCEKYALTQDNSDGWSYMGAREKMSKPEFMATAKAGNTLYATLKNNDLKLRTAYQLVRLSHYAGFNDDAIRYFDKFVLPLKNQSLPYYYALEQKAGALFNLKKYAAATRDYIQVFNGAPGRQLAVYTSFLMSSALFKNGGNLLTTNAEKTTFYMLRGYNGFASGISEMKKIYTLSPNAPALEVLAVREMNKTEREILMQPSPYSGKNIFLKGDASTQAYLKKLLTLTDIIVNNKYIVRKDFWKSYQAHLHFLSGNYKNAESIANDISGNDKQVNEQAKVTAFAAFLAQCAVVGPETEKRIYSYLNTHKEKTTEGYIYELTAHKYLQQKDYAKAFLCHNDLSGLYTSLDLKIIDQLITFYNKPDKNNFEQLLSAKQKNAMTYLYDLKGTHYLKYDQPENALVWFKKVPGNLKFLKLHVYDYISDTETEKDGDFNGYSDISARIFSNGIRPYFEDTQEKAMTDQVYKMPEFKFIPAIMNKQQLAECLIALKKMAKETTESGARAGYLLGNYYYNTSVNGYYRNILFYEPGNYYISSLYGLNNTPTTTPYNYHYGTGIIQVNHLQTAYDYYIQTERVSNYNELKAKAIFQASKIELDQFVAKQNFDYNFVYWENPRILYAKNTRPLFGILKQKYSDTKYYQEIQSNCLYLKYYINN